MPREMQSNAFFKRANINLHLLVSTHTIGIISLTHLFPFPALALQGQQNKDIRKWKSKILLAMSYGLAFYFLFLSGVPRVSTVAFWKFNKLFPLRNILSKVKTHKNKITDFELNKVFEWVLCLWKICRIPTWLLAHFIISICVNMLEHKHISFTNNTQFEESQKSEEAERKMLDFCT